jgi:hypothetical protein
MALRLGDKIEQANRENTVGLSDYFYLIDGADVNFAVESILEAEGDPVQTEVNNKYIVRNAASSPISPQGLGNNDIVRYNGNDWEIFKDVSNTKTDFGIIYDKKTKLFYQYDSINGWKSLIRSGKIDGGTFT